MTCVGNNDDNVGSGARTDWGDNHDRALDLGIGSCVVTVRSLSVSDSDRRGERRSKTSTTDAQVFELREVRASLTVSKRTSVRDLKGPDRRPLTSLIIPWHN